MKSIRTLLLGLSLLIATTTASAQPMSYYDMRNNARFLTDRMAYTLGIGLDLLDELYCINYDYICGVNDYLDDVALGYRYDDYMLVMEARDAALRRLLSYTQWRRLMEYDYFYRPIMFRANRWYFSIYRHDPHVGHFYYAPPRHFGSYRGGRHFGGMDPRGGHAPNHPGGYRFERPGGNPNGGNRSGSNRGTFRPGGNDRGAEASSSRGNNQGGSNRRGDNRSGATRPSAGNNRSSAARSSGAAANGRTSAVRGNSQAGRSQSSRSVGSQPSRGSSSRSAGAASGGQNGGQTSNGSHRGGGRR